MENWSKDVRQYVLVQYCIVFLCRQHFLLDWKQRKQLKDCSCASLRTPEDLCQWEQGHSAWHCLMLGMVEFVLNVLLCFLVAKLNFPTGIFSVLCNYWCLLTLHMRINNNNLCLLQIFPYTLRNTFYPATSNVWVKVFLLSVGNLRPGSFPPPVIAKFQYTVFLTVLRISDALHWWAWRGLQQRLRCLRGQTQVWFLLYTLRCIFQLSESLCGHLLISGGEAVLVYLLISSSRIHCQGYFFLWYFCSANHKVQQFMYCCKCTLLVLVLF